MEELRSKSYNNYGHTTIFSNNNPKPENLRCQSASSSSSSAYASSSDYSNPNKTNYYNSREEDFKKKKKKKGKSSSSSSMNGLGWVFGDPEIQRKKRVASYKAYTVEGKLKGSVKNSFRWIKLRFDHLVHGRS